MAETTHGAAKLSVFISYSRDDLAFADQLDAALGLHDFAATIDREGISGGEDWKKRLGNLIRDSDTVVFVLSPSAAASEMCRWEVEQAERLGKRIIPVLCRPLNGVSPPSRLADLNYIYFYQEPKSPGSGFGTGLVGLVTALNMDFEWLREHTRLLQRATEWDARGRAANRLLSGPDIAEAKAWAARRPKDAPGPTELHLNFIKASEAADAALMDKERQRQAELAELKAAAELQAEKDRSRRRLNHLYAIGTTLLALLVLFSFWQASLARLAARDATRARDELDVQKKRVDEALIDATRARDELDAQKKRVDAALKTVNLSLCKEATKATFVLGTTREPAVWDSTFDMFWTLYWGPMIALETLEKTSSGRGRSKVEAAMFRFGGELCPSTLPCLVRGERVEAHEARKSGLPRSDLQMPAREVGDACKEFTGGR